MPLNNVDYLNSSINAYTETGVNELNLNIDQRDFSSALASLGLQFSHPFSLRWGVIVPQFSVEWEYDFSPNLDPIKGSFVSDADNTGFEFKTDDADKHYFRTEAGASFIFPGGFNAFILYETVLLKAYTQSNNLSFGGRYEVIF
ncbi:MAG: autotransporter outer membrane beta-barrel domain-containing protein [Thiomicrorhabdus sp.]|nr:autotransporter outer membrane beta-barrel domain-containing protein [Thiomicrorhabdus sp.]